ncbi:unnamed protein product [Merluccius merluccius]
MSRPQVIGSDNQRAYSSLMQGLQELDLRGNATPGTLYLMGDHAFPLAMNMQGQVLMAASLFGRGRMVVLGHESYLTTLPALVENALTWLRGIGSENLLVGIHQSCKPVADNLGETIFHGQVVEGFRQDLGDFVPLWHNALRWLDQGRKGVVGVHPSLTDLPSMYGPSGLSCLNTDFTNELSVFVCTAYCDKMAQEMQDFVMEGGGLLIGGHAWYWCYCYPALNLLTDFAGNRILSKMGLNVLGATVQQGLYEAPDPDKAFVDHYHFHHMVSRFAKHVINGETLTAKEEGFLTQLRRDCATYLLMEANESVSYRQVVSHLTDIVKKAGIPQVSVNCPVSSTKDRLLLTIGAELYKCLDPDTLLPYLIRDNPSMPVVQHHQLKINANTAGQKEWISTGLYLSPGMKTYISLPAQIVNNGWKVQIGCQVDGLDHLKELRRAPCVHKTFNITTPMMQVWNLWGGLLYLVAPSNTQVEGLIVTVERAVLVPYYKSGVTTLAEWAVLRTSPAPWAELEFDNIILTIPSSIIRDMERPEEVAALWDDIMKAITDLAVVSPKFPRKERFVADVQISHGNRILSKMGLNVLGATVQQGLYEAPDPDKAFVDHYHFHHMVSRFAKHVINGETLTAKEEGFLTQLRRDCATYLLMEANESVSYRQVVSHLTDIVKKAGIPQVSVNCPVSSTKDRLLLTIGAELYKCLDPDTLLPYLIRDNPSMPVVQHHQLKINANTAGQKEWISTGLYLSPGMKTYISLPAQIVNNGWKVQIGCQVDGLDHLKELRRAPCVHKTFNITTPMMQVWNLWGGLLYLVAPSNTQVEGLIVTVERAVLVPYYKSGVTTLAEWAVLRTSPAPWAELEFDNIILTIPSSIIRDMERPEEVAALWDDIMKAITDLAVVSPKFPRKERFVADVQISHGFMHAGYPIMMLSSVVHEVFDLERARTHGLWGYIHELGHNQQRGCWEFAPHTTECTCNLWSVYVHEEVLGINRAEAHPALQPKSRASRPGDYVKQGKDLKTWNTWVALETYLQLQEAFGWGAFKNVFAAYQDMADVPKDNNGKMNLYTKTFSMAVEKNLCAFFKAWGWPIEAATEEELSKLPPWSDHPMVLYK